MASRVKQSGDLALHRFGPATDFAKPDRAWARRVEAGIRTLSKTPLTSVGEFRCRSSYPGFEEFGNPAKSHLIVFPSHPVGIAQSGRKRFVADCGMAVFYTPGQEYRRSIVSPDGDHCWLIRLESGLAREIARSTGLDDEVDDNRALFPEHGPISTRTILRQRALVRALAEFECPDPLALEEATIQLAIDTVSESVRNRPRKAAKRSPETSSAHCELTNAAKEVIGRRFVDQILLEDLAREIHSSPFHLCRVFREQTGLTIHRYIVLLRLARALDLLADWKDDLSLLGISCGFSHHSHLTNAFKREFGFPPSQARHERLAELAHQMSKKLQA